MPDQSERELLKEILRSLEETKSLFVLVNQEKLAGVKKGLLKEGTVKLQIYDLCDGTNSTQDIIKAIAKSAEYVGSYLSTLRREGLIRTVEKDGRQIYEQVF
jgi:DNA-binding transcriptional ArsR family regulator